MSALRAAVVRVLVVGLTGCGEAGPLFLTDAGAPIHIDPPDAGHTIGADFLPEPPTAPAEVSDMPRAPVAPSLTPCAARWTGVDHPSGPDTCNPWPADAVAQDCAEDEVLWPGSAGCEPIGVACPDGSFPEGLPSDGVVYVLAGASPDGAGTAAAPYPTLTTGLAAASAGTVVAIGKGRYDEAVSVPDGVTLWGACPSETVLAAPPATDGAAVLVAGPGVAVRDLRIAGEGTGIRITGANARARIEGVRVEEVKGGGIEATGGATVEAQNVVVRNVRPLDDGTGGHGLRALGGSTIEWTTGAIERCTEAGALSADGSIMRLEHVVVRDTESPAPDAFSAGLVAQTGGEIEAQGCVVEGNQGAGAAALEGGALVIEASLIREQRALGNGIGGRGLVVVFDGSTAEIRRTLLDRNVEAGIHSAFRGRAAATDVLIRGTRSSVQSGVAGHGVACDHAAGVILERVWIEDNRDFGVFVEHTGSMGHLTDVTVRHMRERVRDGLGGAGINFAIGAEGTVDGVLIEDVREGGLVINGTAHVSLIDLTVRDLQAPEGNVPSIRGDPVAVAVGPGEASLQADRVLVEDARGTAFAAIAGGALIARDARVHDVPVGPGDIGGFGLLARRGGRIDIERLHIERATRTGAFALGGTLDLRDVTIRDTAATSSGLFGRGIVAQSLEDPPGTGRWLPSDLRVERAHIEGNREAAVVVEHLSPEAASGMIPDSLLSDVTTGALSDVLMLDTRSSAARSGGWGIAVQGGARAELVRGHIEGNREVSALSFHRGSTLTLMEVLIRETRRGDCPSCAFAGGIGLGAYVHGRVEARRFRIELSDLVGIQLTRGATGILQAGVVAANPIGANIQSDAVNLEQLTADVLFVGNGRNLDVTTLPWPELDLP